MQLEIKSDASMQQDVFEAGMAEISALLSRVGNEFLPPPKLYRIGEVIQYSGFSRQTIHNYTAMGLIQENQWTQTGHRLYDAGVFRHLAIIKHLKNKFSLSQIKEMMEKISKL